MLLLLESTIRIQFWQLFLKPPFDFDLWHRELGNEYILLLTAHYEVEKLMDIPTNHPFIINAFGYPHINELMLVADLFDF